MYGSRVCLALMYEFGPEVSVWPRAMDLAQGYDFGPWLRIWFWDKTAPGYEFGPGV